MSVSRRAILGGALALLAACKKKPAPAPDAGAADPHSGPLTLTPELRKTLEAAAARILPSDDGPGAAETDAAGYVARQLEDPRLGRNRHLVLRGLIELDAEADRRARRPYAALTTAEQDDVLGAAARGQLRLGKHRSDGFVRALTVLVLEGYLGDPSYGGNKGGAGWAAMGLGALAGPAGTHH